MPADSTAAFFSSPLHFLTLLAGKWAAQPPCAPAVWSWWKGDSLFPLWALHKSRSFLIGTCPCAKAGLDWGMLLFLSWLQCVTLSVFLALWLHSPLVISQWVFTLPLCLWVKNGYLCFTRNQVLFSDCLGSDWEFGLGLKIGLSKGAGWESFIIFLIHA